MLKLGAKLLFAAALAAALTELGLRALAKTDSRLRFLTGGYNRFRGLPHGKDFDFRLNSQGFKDVEFEEKKRPGARRIIGIGDSFVFGVVPYRHNFLTLLEAELGCEVLNMGIAGTDPPDYLEILRAEGLRLSPDAVLVHFFIGNDFTSGRTATAPPRLYLAAAFRFVRALAGWSFPARLGQRYDDSAPTFSDKKYRQLAAIRARIFHKTLYPNVLEICLPEVRAALLGMKEAAARRGARLIVVLVPDELQLNKALRAAVLSDLGWREEELDLAKNNRALGAALKKDGIEAVDLLPAFEKESFRRSLYKPNDSHWNVAGNALAARILAAELRRLGLGP